MRSVIHSTQFYIEGFFFEEENVFVSGYTLVPTFNILENYPPVPRKEIDKILSSTEIGTVIGDQFFKNRVRQIFPTLSHLKVIRAAHEEKSTSQEIRNFRRRYLTVDMVLEYFRFFTFQVSRALLEESEKRKIDKDFIEEVLDEVGSTIQIIDDENEYLDIVEQAYNSRVFSMEVDLYGKIDASLNECINNTRVFLYNIFRSYKSSLTNSTNNTTLYMPGELIPNYVFQKSQENLSQVTNSITFGEFLNNDFIGYEGEETNLKIIKIDDEVFEIYQKAVSANDALIISLAFALHGQNILETENFLYADIDPRIGSPNAQVEEKVFAQIRVHNHEPLENISIRYIPSTTTEIDSVRPKILRENRTFYAYLYTLQNE